MRSLVSIIRTTTTLLCGAAVQVACNESQDEAAPPSPAKKSLKPSALSQNSVQTPAHQHRRQTSPATPHTPNALGTPAVHPRAGVPSAPELSAAQKTQNAESAPPSAAELLLKEGIRRKGYSKALRQATIEGNIERLALLHDAGANLHIRNKKSGDTLLHSAVAHGQKNAARFLLSKGVKVDKKNHRGITPLMLAVKQRQAEFITLLGNAGADANTKLPDGRSLLRAAIEADATDAIPALVALRADIQHTDVDGNTLLHLCAEQGKLAALEALLNAGANLHTRNRMHEAPLHLAVKHDRRACIQLLQRRGAVDDLFTAAMLNDTTTAQMFLKNGAVPNVTDADGRTPLHIAAENGNTELACLLLQHGADALKTDKNHCSALSTARLAGHVACAKQIAQVALKEKGITEISSSQLFHSIEHGENSILCLLLAAGANPNACSPQGWPAIHVATMHNKSKCLDLLLKYGADAQVATPSSFTALHLAVSNDTQACLMELLRAGINLEARTADGCTALHLAARLGNHDALQKLIRAGANVNAQNLRGDTPLNEIARWSWGRADSAQALIDAGADCNLCNILRESPLHTAAISGNKHCLSVLISTGIDTTQKSASGKTPLELAKYHGQQNCATLLQDAVNSAKSLTAAESL